MQCKCGNNFNHRSDRWAIKCPKCFTMTDLSIVRSAYVGDIK